MNEKKKICWVTPDCFTQVDDTVLRHLSNDFEVIWYYICEEKLKKPRLGRKNAQDYADQYGMELHIIDPRVRYRNPQNFFFYKQLAQDINRHNPDIVYHTERNPYWSVAIKWYLNCPHVVIGIHDAKPHSYNLSMSRLLQAYTANYSINSHKKFITFSNSQHDLLLSAYGKDSAMVGMSCKDFGKSDKTLAPISEGIKLLFFGSINEYKGLDLLITALEKLHSEGIKNITLTIAGKGDYWSRCESLIKTKEMYNLQVRFVDNSEIPDLMSTHHFLALPYRDATQSGPLVTAVAYELPVIAPAFGCFTETYDNESAILYKQGELEQTLRKVSSLSQQGYDAMKKACKGIKEANSEERIAQNYIEYFNSLLGSNK